MSFPKLLCTKANSKLNGLVNAHILPLKKRNSAMIHTHTKRNPKGALPSFSDLLSCPFFISSSAVSVLFPRLQMTEPLPKSLPFSKQKKIIMFFRDEKDCEWGRALNRWPKGVPSHDSHHEAAENSREEGGISKTYRALLKPAASLLCNRRPHSVLCICVALTRM